MQKLTLGGKELTLVASPITAWIYKKAFGDDIITDAAAISQAVKPDGDVDIGRLPMFGMIQMAWAMAKTASPGTIPDFDVWLAELPDDALDFTAVDFDAIMTELQRGFFRGAKGDTADSDESGTDAE